MIWFILGAIIWILSMILLIIKILKNWDMSLGVAAAVVAVLLVWCALEINELFYEPDMQITTETRVVETKKLYALQDNVQRKGTYFIGIGGTSEDRYYEMFLKNERGNKEYKKIKAKDVEINDSFSKEKEPMLVTYQDISVERPQNKKTCSNWLSIYSDQAHERRMSLNYDVFEVPAGTVTTEYFIGLDEQNFERR